MTEAQAIAAIKYWHSRYPRSDFVAKGPGGEYLTSEGKHAKKDIEEYEKQAVYDLFATVRNREQWPSWRHVQQAITLYSSQLAGKIPEDWERFGHRCIVHFKDKDVYGIVDMECDDPVIWVLTTNREVRSVMVSPEWMAMRPASYLRGMASPVDQADAEALRRRWRKMKESGEYYGESPSHLFAREYVVPGSAIGTTPEGDDLF